MSTGYGCEGLRQVGLYVRRCLVCVMYLSASVVGYTTWGAITNVHLCLFYHKRCIPQEKSDALLAKVLMHSVRRQRRSHTLSGDVVYVIHQT